MNDDVGLDVSLYNAVVVGRTDRMDARQEIKHILSLKESLKGDTSRYVSLFSDAIIKEMFDDFKAWIVLNYMDKRKRSKIDIQIGDNIRIKMVDGKPSLFYRRNIKYQKEFINGYAYLSYLKKCDYNFIPISMMSMDDSINNQTFKDMSNYFKVLYELGCSLYGYESKSEEKFQYEGDVFIKSRTICDNEISFNVEDCRGVIGTFCIEGYGDNAIIGVKEINIGGHVIEIAKVKEKYVVFKLNEEKLIAEGRYDRLVDSSDTVRHIGDENNLLDYWSDGKKAYEKIKGSRLMFEMSGGM